MHRCKNIAITGARGAGKSALAQWLLAQLGAPVTGFQTVRYELTQQGPLYSLTDLTTGETAPISQLLPEGIRGIPESFSGFGVQVLERCLCAAGPVVLLDEIGRFERSCTGFLETLTALLDSDKTVIAVLKKEDIPHIHTIKARADTLVIDLDRCSREEARNTLAVWLKRRSKKS